jgi:hypothetical protein
MADDHNNRNSRIPSQAAPGGWHVSRGSDLVERLLSKRLERFDEERRKQQTRMEETVQDFALRLFEEESKTRAEAAGAPAAQEQQAVIGEPARPSEAETIIVALDAGLVRQLRAAAEESQTSVSSLVQSGVIDWLEGYERTKKRRQQLRGLL